MQILILEDEPFTARVLQRCLQKAGYDDVTAFPSAEDALAAASERQYDLLIVDWILPGASGLQFVKHLRAHEPYKDVPMVMVTTKSEARDVEQALNAGVNDYIRKPDQGWGPADCKNLVQRIEALHAKSSTLPASDDAT